MNQYWLAIVCFGIAASAHAEPFKSAKECVPGTRVKDSRDRSGTIIGQTKGDPVSCTFRPDGGGRDENLLFWMFHAEGGSAETNDKLVPGIYECFGNGRYTFMDVRISGPNSYDIRGAAGKYRLDPASRKIVFESGPLEGSTSKLLQGPKIGLNRDGGTFFATTCELNRNKKAGN